MPGKATSSVSDSHPNRNPLRGYFFIIACAFLWGVSAALGRAVFTGKLALSGELVHPIDPLILSQARTTFSLLVLLPILLRQGRQRVVMPTRDLVQCLVLGLLGVAASNYFYYMAIQRTSVAIAITVQYTAPVWVLLYVVARGQLAAPNSQAPPFPTIASTPGMTSIALSAALMTSHRLMPNIILEPDERRDVIAYILSLK